MPNRRNGEPVGAGAPRRAWAALVVTTLVFFLSVVDMSAVNVGFPAMVDDLGGTEASLSWVISGYNVTIGALLLVSGRLADSLGRKKLFLPGVAVFLLGSILAGMAPSAGLLIAARVVQGIGGAVIAPTSLAVVLPEFPPQRRSLAIGVAGAVGSLGAVLGPAVGSLSIELWSWRGIFLINVPVCLLVLALAPRLLQESRDSQSSGRVDILGAVLGTLAVALAMVAIADSERWGGGDIRSILILVAGLALVPASLRRSVRHPAPLVDPGLFRSAAFRSANVGVLAWSLGFASGFLANSLFLQQLWQLPVATVGPALVVSPLVAAVVSPLAGRLADRVGHRWILVTGSALCAAGYLSFHLFLGQEPQLWSRFVPLTAIVGVGVGATVATWVSAALRDVPAARLGTANATIRTTQQVFFALGIAVVVTMLSGDGQPASLADHRQAWLFIAGMFAAGALVIAATFPRGAVAAAGAAPPLGLESQLSAPLAAGAEGVTVPAGDPAATAAPVLAGAAAEPGQRSPGRARPFRPGVVLQPSPERDERGRELVPALGFSAELDNDLRSGSHPATDRPGLAPALARCPGAASEPGWGADQAPATTVATVDRVGGRAPERARLFGLWPQRHHVVEPVRAVRLRDELGTARGLATARFWPERARRQAQEAGAGIPVGAAVLAAVGGSQAPGGAAEVDGDTMVLASRR